jgi:hypothetical protein
MKSLRFILLATSINVSKIKIYLDTSILMATNMGGRSSRFSNSGLHFIILHKAIGSFTTPWIAALAPDQQHRPQERTTLGNVWRDLLGQSRVVASASASRLEVEERPSRGLDKQGQDELHRRMS